MSDTSTPPQVPGASSGGPWDFAQFLRRTAGQQTVVKGAGGAYFVIDTAQTRFSMEEASIQWNPSKTTVKTNDPTLDEPNFAGLGLWSTQFSQTVMNVIFGTPEEQNTAIDSISGGDSLLEALQFQQQGMQTFFEETGIEGPGTLPKSVTTNTAFVEWLTEVKNLIPKDTTFLSTEANQILTSMHSSDENTVYAELVDLADLQTLSLTGQQKATIMDRLQKLAKAIAEKNAIGSTFVLNLTIPILMLAAFADTIGLSTDITTSKATKEAIFSALSNITSTLASVNFEKLTNQKPASQTYLALTSGNAQQVIQALTLLTGGYTPPAGVSSSDVSAALSSIANTIASLSPDDRKVLESGDREALTALFSKALENAAASGVVSEDAKKALLASLVPLIVDKTYDVNFAEHSEGLKSTNTATIRAALLALTGINSDKRLTKTAHTVAMSYIQALIDMLSFMSQVRCFITVSQGELSEKLNKAKIASLDEEIQTSAELYKTQLEKMRKMYEKTLDQIKLQELMKLLMPLISIGMSLVMLVIAIGILVSAVFSFGTAEVPEAAVMASLIAAIVGVISAGVSLVLTCIDSGLQLAGKTSMWTDLAKALGITNATEQAAFIAGFQFLIQIVTVVASGGTILALNALKTAAKSAVEESVEVSLEEGAKEGAKAGAKAGAEGAAEVGATVGTGAAGVAVRSGVGTTVEETTSEVAKVGEELATGTTKIALQQAKNLGIKAAWKAGKDAALKAARDVSQKELAETIKWVIIKEILVGTVSCILGSGLVTRGMTKLGELIFHDETDAEIFAMVMTVVIMIAGVMIVAGCTKNLGVKKPTGGSVKAADAGTEAEISLPPKPMTAPPRPPAPGLTPLHPTTTDASVAPPPTVSETLPGGVPAGAPKPIVHPVLPEALPAARPGAQPEGGLAAGLAVSEGATPVGATGVGGTGVSGTGTGAAAAGGQAIGPVPVGAPRTASAAAAVPQVESVGGRPAAPGVGSVESTPAQGAPQPSAVPSERPAAAPTPEGGGEGSPVGVPSRAAGGPPAIGEAGAPGQPTSTQPTAPGQPPPTPTEGAAVPPTPTEQPTPSSAREEPETPKNPREEAEGGETAGPQSQAEIMAGAPGGEGPQATGTQQGTDDTSSSITVTVKDRATVFTSAVRRLREMFSTVLRAILRGLGISEKESKEVLDEAKSQFALAAETSEGVRGGAHVAKKTTTITEEHLASASAALSKVQAHGTFSSVLGRKLSSFLKDLGELFTDAIFVGKGGGADRVSKALNSWASLLRLALAAAKVAAGVEEYKAKMRESELDKILAKLELDTAQLKAVMQLFTQLTGIDQTQTIQDLTDDMSKQFDNWTSLLEMVSKFIEGAGEQVNELSRKANR